MKQRIGLMGGMFDPVHLGHLQVAMAAQLSLQLDQVRLIPCLQPNHREYPFCTPQHRLAMLELAVREHPQLTVDDAEIRRGGTSYTIDTLLEMRERFPDDSLVYILGMDAYASLPAWHRWQELLDLTHFLVVTRPGYQLDAVPLMAQQLAQRQVANAEAMFATPQGKVMIYSELQSPVSSTLVRKTIDAGRSISDLVPEAVESYLHDHDIYRRKH